MNKINRQIDSLTTTSRGRGAFLLRGAQLSDLRSIVDLASQFSLLNLPADKKVVGDKIERSIESFAGGLERKDAEYLFVCEDLETESIVGSSLILAKHGTEETPHYYFKIEKQSRFSDDLGIGFIHQVLRLKEDTDGPTEIGGLLIDRSYRRRPEKLGKQISMVRFLYMGMHPEEFEARVLCELTPPLGEGGRSEFWEALGRRFTGLPYQEADLISQRNKEFISSLFPDQDIYLALLDSKARLVLGRVGQDTRPAQHLLESIGFQYLHEVDPFDGGPHYGAQTKDITVVKNTKACVARDWTEKTKATAQAIVGFKEDGLFRAIQTSVGFSDSGAAQAELYLPSAAMSVLGRSNGDEVFCSVLQSGDAK